jgi:hypothetical protein
LPGGIRPGRHPFSSGWRKDDRGNDDIDEEFPKQPPQPLEIEIGFQTGQQAFQQLPQHAFSWWLNHFAAAKRSLIRMPVMGQIISNT